MMKLFCKHGTKIYLYQHVCETKYQVVVCWECKKVLDSDTIMDSNCQICGRNGELRELAPSKPEYDIGVRTRTVCDKCFWENLKA